MVSMRKSVMLFTALVALAVAQDVSVSCDAQEARVEELLMDIATIKSQNQVDLTTIQTKLEQEASTVSTLQTQLATATRELAVVQTEKDTLAATVAKLQQGDTSGELKAQVQTLETQLASTTRDLSAVQAEKEALVATVADLKQADKTSELIAEVELLKSQLSASARDLTTVENEKNALATTVSQLKEADKTVELTAKVATLAQDKLLLSDKLKKIEADNTAQIRRIEALQAELGVLEETTDQNINLKARLRDAERKISSLREDLKRTHEEMSFHTLLSKYYDHVVDFSASAYDQTELYWEEGKLKSLELYKVHLQPWANEAQVQAEYASRTIQDIYTTHAAATVDPLLDQLQTQVQPVLDVYVPVAKQHAEHAKEEATKLAHQLDTSSRRTRKIAIAKLRTVPSIAPYASKIVDGAIALIVIPIAIFLVRIAASMVFYLLSGILYLVTCCGCCGLAGRKSKTTREVATPVSHPVNLPSKASKGSKQAEQTSDKAPKQVPSGGTPPSKKKKSKKTN